MKRMRGMWRWAASLAVLLILMVVLVTMIQRGLPRSPGALPGPPGPSGYPVPGPGEPLQTSAESSPGPRITAPGEAHFPTLSPWPTVTPFPSPTLRPGPTLTPIPLIPPADNPAGEVFFLSVPSAGGGPPQVARLSVGLDGASAPRTIPWQPDSEPLWGRAFPSPDGSRVALFHDFNGAAILLPDTGAVAPLFHDLPDPGGRFFGWHPDNRQVLMRAEENYPDLGLWLVDSDTGEHITLAVPGAGVVVGGAVSPDGTRVIYAVREHPLEPRQVWMVNSDGREARQLFSVEGPAVHFVWSPDGERIVFVGQGLMVMQPDSRRATPVRGVHQIPGQFPPVWSPDSRYLAYSVSETELSYADPWNPQAFEGSRIIVVDLEEGTERLLFPDEPAGQLDPAWSPDGSQVAFASNRSGEFGLWVTGVDGRGLRALASRLGMLRFPYWRRPNPPASKAP